MNFVSRTPLRRTLAVHIGGKEEIEKKKERQKGLFPDI